MEGSAPSPTSVDQTPMDTHGGQTVFYKLVATLNGRHYSIFDGKTEYHIGEVKMQESKPDHGGGFYVYRSKEEVVNAALPKRSALLIAPRNILRLKCWGKSCGYSNGKVSFTNVLPLEILPMPTGYRLFGGMRGGPPAAAAAEAARAGKAA